MKENELPSYAQLLDYYTATKSLYMIGRDPREVNIEWIRENAYQPKLVDYENLTKEPKESQDVFFAGKKLREKLVLSLISSYSNPFGIENVADRLYEYIITGEIPENVKPEKTPQEYFIRKDVDEIGEAHIKSEKDIANSKD